MTSPSPENPGQFQQHGGVLPGGPGQFHGAPPPNGQYPPYGAPPPGWAPHPGSWGPPPRRRKLSGRGIAAIVGAVLVGFCLLSSIIASADASDAAGSSADVTDEASTPTPSPVVTYTVLGNSVQVVNTAAGGGCILLLCGASDAHADLAGVIRVRAEASCDSATKVTATVMSSAKKPVSSVAGSTFDDVAAGTVIALDVDGDYPGVDGPFTLADINVTCGF
jgi:hypothetical protein